MSCNVCLMDMKQNTLMYAPECDYFNLQYDTLVHFLQACKSVLMVKLCMFWVLFFFSHFWKLLLQTFYKTTSFIHHHSKAINMCGEKNSFICMLQQSRTKLWCIRRYGNGISLACCCHKECLELRDFFSFFFLFFPLLRLDFQYNWPQIIASSDCCCNRSARMWPPGSTTLTDSGAQSPRTVSLECNQTWDICDAWRVTLCSCAQTTATETAACSAIHVYRVHQIHTQTAAVNFTILLQFRARVLSAPLHCSTCI